VSADLESHSNEKGGQGRGGASAQPPTSAPRGSKGSDNNKTSRETSDSISTPDSHGNKKQKQTETDSLTSAVSPPVLDSSFYICRF